MRTIKLKAYTVSELEEEVRKKVLDKYRWFNTEDCEWYKGVFERWVFKLAEYGFLGAKIHFSGFGSQGDGACFDVGDVDVHKLLHKLYKKGEGIPSIILPCIDLTVKIETVNHHYSHENTRDLQISFEADAEVLKITQTKAQDLPLLLGQDDDEEDLNHRKLLESMIRDGIGSVNLEELVKIFEKDAEELRTSLCRKIYSDLSDESDSLTSDDAVIEALDSADYEFTEDGRRI